jgi:nucleotide-binding universal stress UspA family protein
MTTFGSGARQPRSAHGDTGSTREADGNPIVAAVDASDASLAAAQSAARLAREFDTPLVFVHVRRGPWDGLGAPYYQRRLDAEMATARRALHRAIAVARAEGVTADGEILEGKPDRGVLELARQRDARLVVLGSRRRRIGRSVSRRVIHASDRPVVVAGAAGLAATNSG